jgi:NADPH2:quinone reductase
MKAIVLREFGAPEVLSLEEVPTPSLAPGEVLVKVHTVSVNRTLDLKVRAGKYTAEIHFPHVLGVDPAGVVVTAGPNVTARKVGDRVAVLSMISCGLCDYCRAGEESLCMKSRHIGVHRWGGYAEYTAVPAKNTFLIPESVSSAEATVISRHFPMAFNLLENRAQLKPGEWVLIMGATGALGSCGVQVAKLLGANVIAGAGSDERVATAVSYGADFGINYRKKDLASEIMRITEGHGVDVVYENIGDPSLWPGALNSLAWAGRLVTAGSHGGGTVTLDITKLYLRRQRIIGVAGTNYRDVVRSLEAAARGEIRAIIKEVMPLAQAAVAHDLLEKETVIGKVILEPTP